MSRHPDAGRGHAADPADPPPGNAAHRHRRLGRAAGPGPGRARPWPTRTGPRSSAALHVAEDIVSRPRRQLTALLVVAMGRQGGREIGYGSDADVMYVHRPLPGRIRTRRSSRRCGSSPQLSALLKQPLQPAGAGRTRRWRWTRTCAPRARTAPMVRSLDSYRGVLPALVAGLGGPGPAARPADGRRRRAGRRLHRARSIRSATRRIWPARKSARSAGSRRGWSPSGCRAAPIRPAT